MVENSLHTQHEFLIINCIRQTKLKISKIYVIISITLEHEDDVFQAYTMSFSKIKKSMILESNIF